MKLKEVVDKLDLKVEGWGNGLDREVTGGYTSDLLSDVIANSKKGNIWITLQIHQNIVAVATLRELSAIIIIGGKEPSPDTLAKAKDEGIPVITSPLTAFELSGRLYALGLQDE